MIFKRIFYSVMSFSALMISACGNGGTVPEQDDSIFIERTDTSPADHTNTYLDSTKLKKEIKGDSITIGKP